MDIKWVGRLIPGVGLLLLFTLVALLCDQGGFVLPIWAREVLGIIFGMAIFGTALQLNLLKRIGGFSVLLVALIAVAGSLLPKETISGYPQATSDKVVRSIDSSWNVVMRKDWVDNFNPKTRILEYIESFADFDVYRAGQVSLYAFFGVLLGICFLFPLHLSQRAEYTRMWFAITIGGVTFGVLLELVQVLSPSREVTYSGCIESVAGVLLGIIVFVMGHWVYTVYMHRKHRSGGRFNILGIGIDAVNMQDCLDLFQELIQTKVLDEKGAWIGDRTVVDLSTGLRTKFPAMTTAMGVAGIVESRRKQKLQRILNESVLNTPDGMPLVWLGNLFGYNRIERVYGPDLLRDACAFGEDKGWRHYFWGAAPGIVEKLKVVLEEKHPKIEISGICCPPFRALTPEEEDVLVEEVNRSNTDIFWIGISTPKQLYFMDHIRERLHCKIICPVGYAFDVNAGVEKDAPDWIKYSGLQWLHRGIKQPRLWKRYLPDNPMFVFKCILQIFRLKHFPMFMHERPLVPYKDIEGYPRFPAGVVSLSAMTMQGACDRIAGWIENGQKQYVNICTADTIVKCYDEPDLAQIIMKAGMATTDGMPLAWLAKRFGFQESTRVYGPDLMLELCALSEKKGYTHYFFGATDEVLHQLKSNLCKRFPKLKIAGIYSPPFRPLNDEEKQAVVERINAANPDVVWCGLGTPKQDYWVAEFRPHLTAAAIIAVGAAFNFHAGQLRQAPRWMMKCGLEWLFRLLMEPRRLWRRYLIGNTRFIIQTFAQWVRRKQLLKKQG